MGTVPATSGAGRAAGAALLALAALLPCGGRAGPPAPARSLEALDEAFAASARDLVRRAEGEGCAALAAVVEGWKLPPEAGRQFVLAIPARVERPAAADAPGAGPIWDDFLAARRSRAAGTFEHALVAAAAHDAVPTRAERARPRDADAPAVAGRSAEALRLLYRTLWDDPDHARARAAGGWVRHDDAWVSPEAARRLERGEQFDPAYGWLPAAKLARYRAGERFDRGKWVPAADDAARPREVKQGRELHSDHWDVVATAPLAAAAALAARLEETRAAWLQLFGGCAIDADDLEKRFTGRGRTPPRTPHAAVLCATRRQYVAELEPLEPAIGRTNGIYWAPTRTVWFFDEPAAVVTGEAAAAGGLEAFTVHHEATHQLFAEARPAAGPTAAAAVAGERCGFWAVEAVACYMETLAPMPHGWTVGGLDAGRVPAARQRLLEDGDYVPLAELVALGRAALQADDRLTWIYSQAAGLADFLMNGRGGRYREAFLTYLARVYAGTADPDTLARLCGQSYAQLDEEYRRHLAR